MGKSDKIVKNIFDNLERQLTPLNVCSHYKIIEALSLQTKHEEWEEMVSAVGVHTTHNSYHLICLLFFLQILLLFIFRIVLS